MNIAQLEYFVHTVDFGSFSAAARNLFVTPQAVSKAIGELQQEIGTPLIQTESHKARPTEFGQTFYLLALDVLESVERCKTAALAHAPSCSECEQITLAVSVAPPRSCFFTEQSFERFRQEFSHVNLDLIFSSAEACLTAVEEGLADMAVVPGTAEKIGLQSRRLFSFAAQVAFAPNHPLAQRETISLEDLALCTIAMPYDIRHALPKITRAFADAGLRPRLKAIAPNGEAAFLESGGAIFVANHQSIAPAVPHAVVKTISATKGVIITMHLVERAGSTSALAHNLALYLSIQGERIKRGLPESPENHMLPDSFAVSKGILGLDR